MKIYNIETKEGYNKWVSEVVKLLTLARLKRLENDPEYKAKQEALEEEYERIFNCNKLK